MAEQNITICEYDSTWLIHFDEIIKIIGKTLKPYVKIIHHIGSTSIPQMAAKPIIDILLEVENLDDINYIEQILRSHGFGHLNRSIIPHRSFFTNKVSEHLVINCHIYEVGDPQIIRHCRFRDYLTAHPDDARAYEELKKKLAVVTTINDYVNGKSMFVRKIDAQAKLNPAYNTNAIYLNSQNTGYDAATWSKEKTIACSEANFIVAKTHFQQYITDINFLRTPEQVLVDTGLRDTNFNYILDAHFSEEDAFTKIKQLIEYYVNKNLPFSWWVIPNGRPTKLNNQLSKFELKNIQYHLVYKNLDAWKMDFDYQACRMQILNKRAEFVELTKYLPDSYAELKKYIHMIGNIYTPEDPLKLFAFYHNDSLVSCCLVSFYAQLVGIYNLYVDKKNYLDYFHDIENALFTFFKKSKYHIAITLVEESETDHSLNRGFSKLAIFNRWVYEK